MRVSILFVLTLGLAHCRTTPNEQKQQFLDGENPPVTIDPEGDAGVPQFLWSPQQRQAQASYYYIVAEYAGMSGDLGQSRKLLEASYNLDPNPFLGSKLIASEAIAETPETALPDAKRMVLLYPQSSELRLLYGQLLARTGEFDKAAIEIEQAIELQRDNELAYLSLIEVLQRNNSSGLAIDWAKKLLKVSPSSIAGLVALTKLYLVHGPRSSAIEPARGAYELQSSNPELILLYALALEFNERSTEAVALYEQLYRMNPSNDELMARLVEIYRQLGDLEQALGLLNEISTPGQEDKPGIAMQKAFLLWELGRFAEAEQILAALLRRLPDSERIIYMLGVTKERLGKLEEALSLYVQVDGEPSLKSAADLRRGFVLKELKRYAEAEFAIEELLKATDVHWEVFLLQASIQGEQKKFDEAVTTLRRGYSAHSDKHRLLFMIGVYQEKGNKLDDCIATMRQVIKVDTQNSAAFNFLGYLYAERGENLAEAEELIKRALQLKPNDAYYLDSLGWVYYQRGDLEKAEAILMQALALAPEEGVILEHLGEVFWKRGDKSRALEFYEKAVKTDLDVRDRDRIHKRFQDLKSNGS
jgi:tetratricopeptide (TPR) repeat protein